MTNEGSWPKALRRFFYDLLSASKAPPRDGVVAPDKVLPAWIDHVAGLPESLDLARRARESAEARAQTAEDKASRKHSPRVLGVISVARVSG
jgi:hypothetical protein